MGLKETFIQENQMRRVSHQIIWEDSDLASHLFETDPHFIEQLASMVYMGHGEHIAHSLPSGGRVVYYKLKKPLFHTSSGQLISYVDVKGVGLTKSGYQYHKHELCLPRAEFMKHSYFDYPFGPLIVEGMEDAMTLVDEVSLAIRKGFCSPPTLALIKPLEIFHHGVTIKPRELNEAFGYKPRRDFAILQVRGYQSLPSRISDYLLDGDGEPALEAPNYIDVQVIANIHEGRSLWSTQYLAIPRQSRPDRVQIFDQLRQNLVTQFHQIVKSGISPISGHEEPDSAANHVHLQNYAFANAAFIEWSPIVKHRHVSQPYDHLYEVLCSAYEAYLIYGAIILPRAKMAPTLRTFREFALGALYGIAASTQLSEFRNFVRFKISRSVFTPGYALYDHLVS